MSESLTAPVPASLHADFCYTMGDNSMEGAGIHAGDIVAIHDDTPLSSGTIVTGRVCYDAFVLDNKKSGIYYQATT